MVAPLLLAALGFGGGGLFEYMQGKKDREAEKRNQASLGRLTDLADPSQIMAQSNGLNLNVTGLQNIKGMRRNTGTQRDPSTGLLAGKGYNPDGSRNNLYQRQQPMGTPQSAMMTPQQRQGAGLAEYMKLDPAGGLEMLKERLFAKQEPSMADAMYGAPQMVRNPITGKMVSHAHNPTGQPTPEANPLGLGGIPDMRQMASGRSRLAAAEPYLTDSQRGELAMRAGGLEKPEAPPGTKQAFDTLTQKPVFATDEQIFNNPDRYQPIQSGTDTGPGSPKYIAERYDKYASELEKPIEDYKKVRSQAERLRKSATSDAPGQGLSALAAMNSFQRLIDPAVVRGEDVYLIQSAQGWMDQVENYIKNVGGGDGTTRLSDDLLQEMLTLADAFEQIELQNLEISRDAILPRMEMDNLDINKILPSSIFVRQSPEGGGTTQDFSALYGEFGSDAQRGRRKYNPDTGELE
jgi:hypothetical protein